MAENRSRQVKRALELEQLKNDKWIKSLNYKQREIIKQFANREADKIAATLIEQTETCYAAALVELYDEKLTYDEIESLFDIANRMLKENGDFFNEFGRDWRMELDKQTEKVQKRIIELLDKGFNQKAIVEQINKEFNKLKSSHIQIAYKTAKEEWVKPKEEREAAANKKVITKKEAEKIAEEVVKEIEKEVTVAEMVENKAEKDITVFEILSQRLILGGRYGKYTIEDGRMKVEEQKITTEFNNKEELEAYLKAEQLRLEEVREAWEKVS